MIVKGNQGVIVNGGGTFTSKVTVTGANASFNGTVTDGVSRDDSPLLHLQTKFDELLVLLHEEAERLPPNAISAVETVANEARSAQPNKFLITTVLDSVSKLVTSLGHLSAPIIAVKELAAAVLK